MSAHHSYVGWYNLGASMRVYASFIAAGGPVAGSLANTRIWIYPPSDGASVVTNVVMTGEVGGAGLGNGWYYYTFTPNSGAGVYKFYAQIAASSVYVSGIFRVTDGGRAI